MANPDPAVAAAAAVHAVSLKLPTFLAARRDVWFQQTEAQFALRHITTQYYYLLTALDPGVAERMAGDIASTPEVQKYQYLKGKRYTASLTTRRQTGCSISLDLEIGNHPNSVLTSKASQSTGTFSSDCVSCQRMFGYRYQHWMPLVSMTWPARQMLSWRLNAPQR
jgi:hypothetical protein